MIFGWLLDGCILKKFRRKRKEPEKAKLHSGELSGLERWLAKFRKNWVLVSHPCLLSQGKKLSRLESPGRGLRLQLGLLSSNLGLLSFAYLGLQGIRLDEEPLITHSVNIRKTTKLFT